MNWENRSDINDNDPLGGGRAGESDQDLLLPALGSRLTRNSVHVIRLQLRLTINSNRFAELCTNKCASQVFNNNMPTNVVN